MSFILDALKKSEAERQQSNATEFASVPRNPTRQSVPRWLLVLGFLLAINLAVLLGLLIRSDSATITATKPAIVSQARSQESAALSFAEQAAAARQQPPPVQSPRQQPQDAAEPVQQSQPAIVADLISQDPSSVPSEQLYPTIQEVRVGGTVDLPELHLDIHVYSAVPEDRFVFINMTKLREGSQLAEGPRLMEITPDGAVLKYRNTSFVVPRE